MKNNDHKITKQNFAEALTEVRKAYRLIYQFQDQILKLINYIGAFYSLKKDNKHHFHKKFSPLLEDKIHHNFIAWNMLPMYYSEFSYFHTNFYFRILLTSDTGWFDNNLSNNLEKYNNLSGKDISGKKDKTKFYKTLHENKLNINTYNGIKQSRSLLIFLLEKNNKNSLNDDKGALIANWLLFKEFFDKNQTSGIIGTAFYTVYPLEEFYSLEATDKILKDFAEKAEKYDYNLKILKN